MYEKGDSEDERTYLGAGQDDFPEDEEHDFGLDHAVDQTGEELWRIKLVFFRKESLARQCSGSH
jgi:hypothetical protein